MDPSPVARVLAVIVGIGCLVALAPAQAAVPTRSALVAKDPKGDWGGTAGSAASSAVAGLGLDLVHARIHLPTADEIEFRLGLASPPNENALFASTYLWPFRVGKDEFRIVSCQPDSACDGPARKVRLESCVADNVGVPPVQVETATCKVLEETEIELDQLTSEIVFRFGRSSLTLVAGKRITAPSPDPVTSEADTIYAALRNSIDFQEGVSGTRIATEDEMEITGTFTIPRRG
ncbi:MAG TPA: hypothetical protein VJ927_12375 [Actinomycetota bacterium]|nr:hypothetical protein [Actinomycetota bacterium]